MASGCSLKLGFYRASCCSGTSIQRTCTTAHRGVAASTRLLFRHQMSLPVTSRQPVTGPVQRLDNQSCTSSSMVFTLILPVNVPLVLQQPNCSVARLPVVANADGIWCQFMWTGRSEAAEMERLAIRHHPRGDGVPCCLLRLVSESDHTVDDSCWTCNDLSRFEYLNLQCSCKNFQRRIYCRRCSNSRLGNVHSSNAFAFYNLFIYLFSYFGHLVWFFWSVKTSGSFF